MLAKPGLFCEGSQEGGSGGGQNRRFGLTIEKTRRPFDSTRLPTTPQKMISFIV